jgi:Flp pilus assembly pilin Flp
MSQEGDMKLTRILSSLVRAISGQDLVESALMAGFVAVAVGAIIPGVSENIERIFKKVECSYNNKDLRVNENYPWGGPRFQCIARLQEGGR